jgi:hypothetical protein
VTRLAVTYRMSEQELLRHNLGARFEISPRSLDDALDLDPPGWVLAALSQRTGNAVADLRRMTIAGWVPWLLDDLRPDPDATAFTTYVRQHSVLLPHGRSPVRQILGWRAWLPSARPERQASGNGVSLMFRACPRCLPGSGAGQDVDHCPGLTLMARIPLMLSCPRHRCLLDPVLGHPVEHLFWPGAGPTPRAADPDVVVMDGYTQEALSTGVVRLPHRPVHAGVWFRLLRTLLDEVSSTTTKLSGPVLADLRLIWQEAGHPFRGGASPWKPYEILDWPRQQVMLHAAAVALRLVLDGRIHARGTLGHLLAVPSHQPVPVGDLPRVDPWVQVMADVRAAIEAAQRTPAIAGGLFAYFTMSSDSRGTYDRARRIMIDIGIPAAFIPPFRELQRT